MIFRSGLNISKDNKGNGILEMILFTPLALLILFVGSDIGLSYLDRAMLTDAVRETSHQQLVTRVSSTGNTLYQAKANGVLINNTIVNVFALNLADRISQVASQRRVGLGRAGSEQEIRSTVTPVVLNVNTVTGVVESFSKLSSITSNFGNPDLTLGPKVKVLTHDQYLESVINTNNIGSSYAIPAPIYNDTGNLFLPQSLAFLVTVEALSPSINPVFLEQILGSNLGIQIQDFHVIRN